MKVSIIVTTYNKPDFLRLCLDGIRNQSIMPFEVVVADDGSDDRTAALIREYQKDFPVPLVHAWQPDEGFRLARSRNNGIRHASGDYLLFIDGDVILHHHFVKDLLGMIRPGEIVYTDRIMLSENYTRKLIRSGKAPKSVCPLSRSLMTVCNDNPEEGVETTLRKRAFRLPFLGKDKGLQTHPFRFAGAMMGSLRKNFESVNGFDNAYTGWGHEDIDLAARMWNNGIRVRQLKNCCLAYHLWHDEGQRKVKDENLERYRKTLADKRIRTDDGVLQIS